MFWFHKGSRKHLALGRFVTEENRVESLKTLTTTNFWPFRIICTLI